MPFCWLDAIHYKVKDENGEQFTFEPFTTFLVINRKAKRTVGMYVSKVEGANFETEVLTDLQNRGGSEHLDLLY